MWVLIKASLSVGSAAENVGQGSHKIDIQYTLQYGRRIFHWSARKSEADLTLKALAGPLPSEEGTPYRTVEFDPFIKSQLASRN